MDAIRIGGRRKRAAAEAEMRKEVTEEMTKRMDTGVRVDPMLAKMWGVDDGASGQAQRKHSGEDDAPSPVRHSKRVHGS